MALCNLMLCDYIMWLAKSHISYITTIIKKTVQIMEQHFKWQIWNREEPENTWCCLDFTLHNPLILSNRCKWILNIWQLLCTALGHVCFLWSYYQTMSKGKIFSCKNLKSWPSRRSLLITLRIIILFGSVLWN